MFVDIFDNTNKPTEPQRTDRCSCGASSIRYINKSVRFAGWLGNARVSVSVFEVGKTVIAASADGGQRVTAVNRSAPGQQTHSHCRPIVLRFVFAPLLLVQLVFVVDFFVFSFFFFSFSFFFSWVFVTPPVLRDTSLSGSTHHYCLLSANNGLDGTLKSEYRDELDVLIALNRRFKGLRMRTC